MGENFVVHFEGLCNCFFGQGNQNQKKQAENELIDITSQVSFVDRARSIIEKSRNIYALTIAGNELTKLITQYWNNFNDDSRLSLRDFAMEYLVVNRATLPPMVVNTIAILVTRISKLGWNSDSRQRDVLSTIERLIDTDVEKATLGFQLLTHFVVEMNKPLESQDHSSFRRSSIIFRNSYLQRIMEITFTSLEHIHCGAIVFPPSVPMESFVLSITRLLTSCLSFDFTGVPVDEMSEEVGTVFIPSHWDVVCTNSRNIQLLFIFFHKVKAPVTTEILRSLVLLSSIRRSIFREPNDRLTFLNTLIEGIANMLERNWGLDDADTYHELCQLVSRLKCNFQLSELMRSQAYDRCMTLITQFTINTCAMFDIYSNSISYLLTLWSRLACAERYVQSPTRPPFSPTSFSLTNSIHAVTAAYINGRVSSAITHAVDQSNTLIDSESLLQEFHQLPQIVRYSYKTNAMTILSVFEPLFRVFESEVGLVVKGCGNEEKMHVASSQLGMLINIITSIVSSQFFMEVQIESLTHSIDADLCSRVFSVAKMVLLYIRSSNGESFYSEPLEQSLISFYSMFFKTIIVFHSQYALPGSTRPSLQSAIDSFIHDCSMGPVTHLLAHIITHIAYNLRYRGLHHSLIQESLVCLLKMTKEFGGSKLLLNIDEVRYLVQNNRDESIFRFLNFPANISLRSLYFHSLTNLVLLECVPGHLEMFCLPITHSLQRLAGVGESFSPAQLGEVMYLCRDLIGVVDACTTQHSLITLIHSLSPSLFAVLEKALLESQDHTIIISIFKLMGAFANNRNSRLNSSTTSEHSLTLFKITASLTRVYGERLLSVYESFELCSDLVYKGIKTLLSTMKRFLTGSFVPFGIFEVLSDSTLTHSLITCCRIIMRIPYKRLTTLTKLAQSSFAIVDILFECYVKTVSEMETEWIIGLLSLVTEGINSFDTQVVKSCASSLDHLASYLYMHSFTQSPTVVRLKSVIASQQMLWATVYRSLFFALLFGSTVNMWSLSRPLLSVYLLEPSVLEDLFTHICYSQPDTVSTRLKSELNALVNEVDKSLEHSSRDEFSKLCSTLRYNLLSYIVL